MQPSIIRKKLSSKPNLENYEKARKKFSWKQAEKEIEFLKNGIKEEVVSGKKRDLNLVDKKASMGGDEKNHSMGKYC